MGLTDLLGRAAARHTHVLVVEVPGSWATRALVERAVLDRGWSLAFGPADADVLVVCGEAGSGLRDAVEHVWHQMPGPRVRVVVDGPDGVAEALDEAHRVLLDTEHHRRDAHERPAATDLLASQGDHGDMDHGDMDHGDMDMTPAGIPLADGGEDRDGLEMDVLHVRLGPVLAHWPAGLVLRCALQGDVVVEAEAELLEGRAPSGVQVEPLARAWDDLASLLALAGWDDAAAEARRLRDDVLRPGGGPASDRAERLRRRVRRSRALRWSLRGVRPLSQEEVADLGLPRDAVGDTYERLIGMLERASGGARHHDRAPSVDSLARLVIGLDLATARLVVASLGLHELQPEHAGHGMAHG